MHACCEYFVMIFSLLFIDNFFISLLLCFLLIFDIDLLSSGSERSFIFEGIEGEDLLLLEKLPKRVCGTDCLSKFGCT